MTEKTDFPTPIITIFGDERGGDDMIASVTMTPLPRMRIYHGGSCWNVDWTDEDGKVQTIVALYPDATWEDKDV